MAFRDRARSLRGYLAGASTSGRPYRLVVEVTNACNLRCSMCPRAGMTRHVEHMPVDVFATLIERNRDSLEFVALNGYGEPLLHPQLFEILKLCRDNGVATGISTNCTQLTEPMAERLLEHGPDQLTLAVDSVEKQSYEAVRVGACFEDVMENVRRFLRLHERRPSRMLVVLQCIYMTETRDRVADFYRAFSGYRYDAVRIRQLTYSGNERTDADYRNRQTACYWLWVEPMVLSDGTLVPCCQDVDGALALGHVQEHSLQQLWNSENIGQLRAKHARLERGTIPLCRTCNMYQPNAALASCAALTHTARLNGFLPRVESLISRLRYRRR